MTTPIDTQSLRAIARAATPGPWAVQTDLHPHMFGGAHKENRIRTDWIHGQLRDYYPIITGSFGIPAVKGGPTIHMVSLSAADAAHIAAAHPAAVLALLDEIDRLRAEVGHA
jgi:hypothetical protein